MLLRRNGIFFAKSVLKSMKKNVQILLMYSCMPVVNSPRMGECGYTGGSIDLERDGVYKEL